MTLAVSASTGMAVPAGLPGAGSQRPPTPCRLLPGTARRDCHRKVHALTRGSLRRGESPSSRCTVRQASWSVRGAPALPPGDTASVPLLILSEDRRCSAGSLGHPIAPLTVPGDQPEPTTRQSLPTRSSIRQHALVLRAPGHWRRRCPPRRVSASTSQS